MITAVVFDAFGTVLELRSKLHPFRQLLKDGIAHGRTPSPNDVRVLMSNPWSLEEAASQLGISISPTRLKALQGDLEREIASISPLRMGLRP
ncbi:haloacid dehalogenase-like family hydrolase [Pseudomonas syringae pv. actinidiae]|nr:haloacid dehalogenase-like family hydrolase [Pseudomonas syringae pv. actinidiae]